MNVSCLHLFTILHKSHLNKSISIFINYFNLIYTDFKKTKPYSKPFKKYMYTFLKDATPSDFLNISKFPH